ncbi:MAG TPA: ketol-acid reductoisomerase [Terriglobales bacterium]|nr:ketol-acid reductoisomerase [Terriglobales bacterium]
MNVLYERDADWERLRRRRIAIIGFGSQGGAQARNLRDSGCDVIIGARPGGAGAARARAAGFSVRTAAQAAAAAEVVMLLVPDEQAPEIYQREIAPHLLPGAFLGFSHGFSIHFGAIRPAAEVNVFLVAPKGPGAWVRGEFERGGGVPCLLAVAADPSGGTRALGLAYAAAIGGGRAGILETTFAEETETDLFGEQAVLCGGTAALVAAGFETLVDAGYAPEMAFFECLHELKLIVDLFYRGGLTAMWSEVSNTARYGGLTRGARVVTPEVRAALAEMLAGIRSGDFAREWLAEHRGGAARLDALTRAAAAHPLEEVGARLRAMMPWLAAGTAAAKPAPAPEPAPVEVV